MAVSMATLQIYDHYLTTYRHRSKNNNNNQTKGNKRVARTVTHNQDELKSVYSAIQWKNRFAPLYMNEPAPKSIAYAVHLKESAQDLKQTINSLSEENGELFSIKTAYSDNEALASVDYVSEDSVEDAPNSFDLKIESFASPQVNTGKYLDADAPVGLEPDSYSFDILTNRLHYELQFVVGRGETHSSLQNKLARLINNSDLGVSAKVLEKDGQTALEITSDSIGKPFNNKNHFTITEESTSYRKGVADYLGLNDSIKSATNAVYTVNGSEGSSYSNMFDVYGAYHITLHPENADNVNRVKIGLYPDAESLSYNIETFVDGYNNFLKDAAPDLGDEEDNNDTGSLAPLTRLLTNDMGKFLKAHSRDLAQYGISINDDATLDYSKVENMADPSMLRSFGSHVLRKLNSISLDPMEYVDRRICAYSNPSTSYINPYMTSIYTGMLFNLYT